MKTQNNKLNIFLGNFALVGFLVAVLVGYWAAHMHTMNTDVNLIKTIIIAFAMVVALTTVRTWLTLKLGDEN